MSSGRDTDRYLACRLEKLTDYDKWVVLMIDEIYVAKRVEFSGTQGQLFGVTADSETASTVLGFMIASVAGKYRDIVGLYELNGLTTEKLMSSFLEVMKRLSEIGFKVFWSEENFQIEWKEER